MLNKCIIIGRLCKDVENMIAAGKDGDLSISRYSLAVDRKGKKDETDFISCVCFGKTADFAAKYLSKGMKVAIEGRIQTGKYEKDGRTVYTTDVVVENHEFCEGKKTEEGHKQDDVDSFMNVPEGIEDEMPFARK